MPTGNVKTYGIAEEDNTLAARNTINDVDGISGSISYQWKRDGSAISGATASTYTLIQDDVGAAITVTASYSDEQGTAESVTSSATSSVSNVNDEPTGLVTISGTDTQGETFTAVTSVITWGDSDRGGGSSSVSDQLQSGVSQLFSTGYAFAALKEDGSVITWGYSDYGGNSSAVAGDLQGGVSQLFSTEGAFAALKEDGSVITWGSSWGGDSSAVSDQLSSGVVSFADPFQDDRLVFAGSGSGLTSDPSPALTLTIDTSAPTFTSGDTAVAIDENSGAAQVVYTATASDLSPVTYSLKPGNNDDAAAFSIDSTSGQVTLSVDPDHETQSSYAFTVVATDAAGNTSEQAVALAVNDLNEDPTNLLISASAFDENITADSVVATFSSTDPDDGDTFTYSLVSGSGDTDNSAFSIVGDQLKIVGSPNFQTQESYSVRLQTTDAGGLPFEKAFTLSVNDIEEEPNSGDTFAEYGQISVNQNWQTIDLDQTYTNAVIIASDPTLKGGDPVAVRIRNIGTDSFHVTMQEEEQLNSGIHVTETIGWVAMDQGVATDGDTIIEGGVTPDVFTDQTKTHIFEGSFDSAPTLLTKLSTFDGADVANSRIQLVSSTGFSAMVQEEQSKDSELCHTTEMLAYLAFDGSSGTIEAVI